MNIIITGPKHIGKSTIISRIIRDYPGSISGFVTEFDNRECSTRELRLRDISCSESRCAVRWQHGVYNIISETFDEFAPDLIDCSCDMIIIDELGKFEKESAGLKLAVNNAFDSPCHVVAAVRFDAPSWMHELKNRDDTTVLTVTEDNRDFLPAEILGALSGYRYI